MFSSYCEILSGDELQGIRKKYTQFQDALNDVQKAPVKVFPPLCPRAVEQMALVQEINKYLQNKKNEDLKAAEAKLQEEAKSAQEAETPKEQST